MSQTNPTHAKGSSLIDREVPDVASCTGWARKIGPHKFMLLEKRGPVVQLVLRHYAYDKLTGTRDGAPREITLNRFQTKDLLECLGNVKSSFFSTSEDGQPTQKKLFGEDGKMCDDIESESESDITQKFSFHIGRNTFVQKEDGKTYLHIRSFYFDRNKKLRPSPRGITLFKEEFLLFSDKIFELNDLWGDIDSMISCGLTHGNEEDFNQCTHCSPKCPF